MATKLNWTYDDASGEYHAEPREGYRIRAVRDENARNPFTDGDCNWPIVVRSDAWRGSEFVTYDRGSEARGFGFQPFRAFNDALLLHWQQRIARDFNSTIRDLIECYGLTEDALPEGKLACRDAETLRDVFEGAWADWSDSDKFDLAVKLYAMCDIVAVSKTVTGHSQGDWAEVLVIATPEALERFGRVDTPVTEEELEAAADLYGAWAWGDVYGYIVEKLVDMACPDDGNLLASDGVCGFCGNQPDDHEPEWEEVEDVSCWGFYGTDFDESGLEESALECVPAETPELEMTA